MSQTMREEKGRKTIVALDVGSRQEALALVEDLAGLPGMFKVGLELFVAEGPDIVRRIVDRGERVFLDLKLHDIPNTVSRAAEEAAKLGVSMLTVHGAGGAGMIRATVEALDARFGDARPIVAAVTVLTSLAASDLAQTGIDALPADQVRRLAELSREAGADGLVCSPGEVRDLREHLGPGVRFVTPGVRMPGQSVDDQKRVATPGKALQDGADWVVVGRWVNRAAHPRAALVELIDSI